MNDPMLRRRKRQEAVDRLGRQIQIQNGDSMVNAATLAELNMVKQQMERERLNRMKVEADLKVSISKYCIAYLMLMLVISSVYCFFINCTPFSISVLIFLFALV